MEQTFDQLKQSIDEYMNKNEPFVEDFNRLVNYLNSNSVNEPIIKFAHEIDIDFVFESEQNVQLSQYLVENIVKSNSMFRKCIIKKLDSSLLRDRKLWFTLKPNNLPNDYCIKNYYELQSNDKKLISIDFLQIVSLSCDYKSIIAAKFVRSDRNRGEDHKWKLRKINQTHKDLFAIKSKSWIESKSERVSVLKRKALVKIGNDRNSGLHPLEITFINDIFSQQQLEAIYCGSHLESVVLLQVSPNVYQMLSFKKICRKMQHILNPINKLDFQNHFVLRFPKEIQHLYNDRKGSNYSFALSLAFVFADNICVSGSYFRLKLGLLLSLLSLDEYPQRSNSSVLVVCDDTLMISRLFEWSSIFIANRFLHTSPLIPMTGVSRKQSDLEWIDCGSLQLADDGVCVITSACDLNELPEKEKISLFHALETNEVIAKQSQPSFQHNSQTELKSTIWAAIEHNSKHYSNRFKNQIILWNEVFGMVYVVDDQMDIQSYEQLENRTLTRNVWQNFLDLANQLRPIMTEEAETLLQSYYVAIRRIRGSKCNRLSMETLVSLSKSFAKLSIRTNVTKYDALMAILLYEESLTAKFPQFLSPLNVRPVFHVKTEDINWAIGPDCDQLMAEFEQRLYEFLRLQAKSSSTSNQNNFTSEE